MKSKIKICFIGSDDDREILSEISSSLPNYKNNSSFLSYKQLIDRGHIEFPIYTILSCRESELSIFTECYNKLSLTGHKIIHFLVLKKGEKLLNLLSGISPYSAIFPPIQPDEFEYKLSQSLTQFKHYNSLDVKTQNFLKEHRDNKKKLKELDSIFAMYEMVEKKTQIENLLQGSLQIISTLFQQKERISIRITYMDKIFESDIFEISTRKISQELINNGIFKGEIEIFIADDDLEAYPVEMEELNTLSTIKSLLSRAIEEIIFLNMKKTDIEYTIEINSLFRKLTEGAYKLTKSIYLDTLSSLDSFFHPDSLCLIPCSGDWKPGNLLTLKEIDNEELSEISNICEEGKSGFKNNERGEILIHKDQDKKRILIPFEGKEDLKGVLIMFFYEGRDINPYFNLSSFGVLTEFLSLAVSNIENLRHLTIYRQAIEQSPSGIVITDLDGSISYVNPHYEKITGYSSDEVLGRNPKVLKSGFQDQDFYRKLWETISSGDQWRGVLQNRCKDGSIIWESSSISPIKDGKGEPFAYIAIKEDITKRMEAERELRKTNENLINTQTTLVKEEKLASIGRLAAGVAHELNNPVGFINSNFTSLKKYSIRLKEFYEDPQLNPSEELKESYQTDFIMEDIFSILEESEEGFERILNIINSLRSFSRIDDSKKKSLSDLNELLRTTLVVASNEVKYKAHVECKFGEIEPIPCVAGEINQVLLNILVNASQAMDKGDEKGHIWISTYREENNIVCRIADDGPGIGDEDRLKIFDPFYTTKDVGQGTGLGLSISYDIIVEKHGGELFLDNSYENGSCFIIKLPLGDL